MDVLATVAERRLIIINLLLNYYYGGEPIPLGTMRRNEEMEDFDCPVCLNNINDREKKVHTTCGHNICMDCSVSLHPIEHDCVSCPLCRAQLTRLPLTDVSLKTVPLNKIRQRLEKQNRIIADYRYQIENAPNDVYYYLQRIEGVKFHRDTAIRNMNIATELQEALQEQINLRGRPRKRAGAGPGK